MKALLFLSAVLFAWFLIPTAYGYNITVVGGDKPKSPYNVSVNSSTKYGVTIHQCRRIVQEEIERRPDLTLLQRFDLIELVLWESGGLICDRTITAYTPTGFRALVMLGIVPYYVEEYLKLIEREG